MINTFFQFEEYGHSPAAEKIKTVNEMSKVKHEDQEDKRSAVNVPSKKWLVQT